MAANPGGKTVNMGEEATAGKQTPAGSSPERITVALIPKAAADLQSLQDRSGLSKTDLANRAITLYEFIDAQIREGKEVLIRDPATKETQRVHLFL
jgi:hypothetical protein